MNSIRTLAGDTMIYGLSTILTRMLNYLMFPYLTYLMGQEAYGEVTDMYSIIPFALVVLTMGLESGFFRFTGRAENDGEKRQLFATTWGATILAAVMFFGIVVLFNRPIASAMGYADRSSYIWITALIILLDVVAAMPFAKLREQRRRIRYVTVRLVSVVVNILFCVFFFSVLPRLAESGAGFWQQIWNPEFGAGYVLVANVFASAAAFLLLLPTTGRVVPRISPKVFRQIMLYSLPLLISGIAGTGNEFIDRQLIKWLLPEEAWRAQLGIYGATTRLAVIMVLFTQMYRLAAEPFFLAKFKKEDFVRQTAETMKYYVIVTVLIFVGIMLFSDVIVLIAGPRFRGASHLLPILLVANALAGVVLNLSFWYKQESKTKYAIWITGTGLVVVTTLCMLLIPRFGIDGAAWARLACEIAMVAVSLWLNQKYCPTPYDFRRIGRYILLGAAIYGVSFATAMLAPWLQYSLNAALLAGLAVYVIWKENLMRYIRPKYENKGN